MKKVLVLGASGKIAQMVTDDVHKDKDIELSLFLRTPKKLAHEYGHIITGDVMNEADLQNAMAGIDIVGPRPMAEMARNVISAMNSANVHRLIWVASAGIYHEVEFNGKGAEELGDPDDPKTYLGDEKKAADLIETSGLDYTIIRPNWLTNDDATEHLLTTRRNEQMTGKSVSRKTVAKFIADLLKHPDEDVNESVGLSTDPSNDKDY
ncbi:saccharopine dehydrogenase related protein [Lactobacillus selangorensis]|uniref:Saccharopine dehydrogenase related protein n=1 Tax=Lactobacillus selangorensis TaxID=81857 RepID=A0A0R2G7Q4_9LACO|nr:NAD(P)H-binding protein [Lactobacillus selangorensis]KRN28898.1 saccharopine dehydrogenase related protein [Lactobacillus selangorensis]KRN32692.1 saccharopine dehydrogenase related protein [Lactobacillus selangorensis]